MARHNLSNISNITNLDSNYILQEDVKPIDKNYPRKLYMGESSLKVLNEKEESIMKTKGWYSVERRLCEIKGVEYVEPNSETSETSVNDIEKKVIENTIEIVPKPSNDENAIHNEDIEASLYKKETGKNGVSPFGKHVGKKTKAYKEWLIEYRKGK